MRSMRYTNEILKRVSVEDKQNILAKMQKGKNKLGGNFGGKSPEREPSPNATVSGFMKQSMYNHSQRDPIIVRGPMNVLPEHPVIRKNEFR